MIYIGIDPGSTTGVVFWNSETRVLKIQEYSSHCAAILYVELYIRGVMEVKIIIEDARKAKARPDLKEVNKGKLQGVGYVKAYSKDWEAFCKLLGVPYELKSPSNTKVSPEYFERLTGLKTLKTQSHCRDAAMLVFGK